MSSTATEAGHAAGGAGRSDRDGAGQAGRDVTGTGLTGTGLARLTGRHRSGGWRGSATR